MSGRAFALVVAAAAVFAAAAAAVHAASSALAVGTSVQVPSKFRTLGVASGDGAVWTTDGSAALTRVDPSTRTSAATVPIADADIVVADSASVWVVGSNSIATRIDPQTNAVIAKVRVASTPTGAALGGGSLWIAGRGGQTITRLNETTGRVLAKVATPESPRYVAVGGGAVWAASNDSPTIWRINPSRNKVVASVSLTDTPNGMVATATGVWVLGSTNDRIVRINPTTNKIAGTIAIPKQDGFIGYGGAITADLTSVWVATLTHLVQLDARTGKILAAIAVGTHASHDPVGLTAVSSGPAGLWVGDGDSKAVDEVTHS